MAQSSAKLADLCQFPVIEFSRSSRPVIVKDELARAEFKRLVEELTLRFGDLRRTMEESGRIMEQCRLVRQRALQRAHVASALIIFEKESSPGGVRVPGLLN
jgi:hypothetical protein